MAALSNRLVASVSKSNGYPAAIRYPFLIVILLLLFMQFKLQFDYPQFTSSHLDGFVVVSVLLLNHLAFGFPWPYRFRFPLRLAALAWAILACVFVFARLAA